MATKMHGLAALASQPLVSTTLSEQVANRIVQAISSGAVKGGQRLVEAELAALLGISRLPVREALRSLLGQGLLMAAPRRGLQVIDFDSEWATQLSRIRIALELSCVRLAVKRLKHDRSLRERILEPLSVMKECAARLDRDGVNRADIGMHSSLYDVAGSPLLSAIWSGISRHVLVLFSIESSNFRNFDHVVAEHQRYATTILSGDLPKIEEEIHRHFTEFNLIAKGVGK